MRRILGRILAFQNRSVSLLCFWSLFHLIAVLFPSGVLLRSLSTRPPSQLGLHWLVECGCVIELVKTVNLLPVVPPSQPPWRTRFPHHLKPLTIRTYNLKVIVCTSERINYRFSLFTAASEFEPSPT